MPKTTAAPASPPVAAGDEQPDGALILTGSPRKDGVTARLAACFERVWAESRRGPVFRVDAYSLAARPCSHCGYCKTVSACVHTDLDGFDAALRRSAFVVVAAPVYMLGFPAPVKAILDRGQRYFEEKYCRGNPRPMAGQRSMVLLSACGSNDTASIDIMEQQLHITFQLVGARLVRTIVACHTDAADPDFAAVSRELRAVLCP